jgi:hypothetical protein
MRLWTVHPKYLDARGLVALWREALLAQKALRGRTVGYRFHPQLSRFRAQVDPNASIAAYLQIVYEEAAARGYRFDSRKIGRRRGSTVIVETRGQLLYEWKHLKNKLRARQPAQFAQLADIKSPEPHPLFKIVPGKVRAWESIAHPRRV